MKTNEFFLVIYTRHGTKAEIVEIQLIEDVAELLNKQKKLLIDGQPFKIFGAVEIFSLPRPIL